METEAIFVLEANIDDMNPQNIDYVFDLVLQAGVKDVWCQSIMMKKNRLGLQLQILLFEGLIDTVTEILFSETTTIGIRYYPVERKICERRFQRIPYADTDIQVKISSYGGKVVNISAEYDECKKLAAQSGAPIKKIQTEVVTEAYRIYG